MTCRSGRRCRDWAWRLRLIVEALSPDGTLRFRHAGEADLTELADAEASGRALGLSLGEAVREEAGDVIFI